MLIAGLEVEVIRKPVKNVNLRVRADGSIVVSAPARVPLTVIERFVREKQSWIDMRQEKVRRRAEERDHPLSDGATVWAWGLTRTLRVVREQRKPSVVLTGDELLVFLTSPADVEPDPQELKRLVRAWQRQDLAQAIERMLPDCEERVGKRASRITIKQMRTRWGSCNVGTGSISINLELQERSPRCLESILIHELCHLWSAGHGPAFYAHMDHAMPDWRKARAELKAHPPRGRETA